MSSRRPTNGLTIAAPAFAASSACAAEKHERDVHLEAFARQCFARAHAVPRERHFDDDVLVDRGEVAAFAKHALPIGGEDFGTDGALHDVADLLHRLAIVAGLLRHERWVRRHAVDDADVGERLDFLDVACVYEQLHNRLLLLRFTLPLTVFRSSPMPSIFTVNGSPLFSGPTPDGVPVAITSPGSSVMTLETKATICGTGKINCRVFDACFRSPFSHPSTSSGRRVESDRNAGTDGRERVEPLRARVLHLLPSAARAR